MTLASEFVDLAKRIQSCGNAAHRLDGTHFLRDKHGDGYEFYYFSDGSSAGVYNHTRPMSVWEVGRKATWPVRRRSRTTEKSKLVGKIGLGRRWIWLAAN
jgi:hypothetical protein